jgi:flagellar motor switch protein FliM
MKSRIEEVKNELIIGYILEDGKDTWREVISLRFQPGSKNWSVNFLKTPSGNQEEAAVFAVLYYEIVGLIFDISKLPKPDHEEV